MSGEPNILHIAPTPFFSDRGCHMRIAGVVRCLARLNYHNEVCTYHTGKDVADINSHRIGNIKGYTKTSAGPSPYKLWADLKLLILVVRKFKQLKPVAIHAHLHEGVLIALLTKLIYFWKRTPIIADMQGSLVGELETYGVFKKYKCLRRPLELMERTLLRFSNKIICSSQHSVDLFTTTFPELADKISLAQDGADAPALIPEKKTDVLRKSLGIDKHAVCIVYSGALLESKGLSELKNIILLTNDCSKEVQFLIIGYPIDDLQIFLEQHNLQNQCVLTGQLAFSALADHLALGHIAIDPKKSSAGEGSGKIMNYMANEMPVVAFDTTNNRQYLGESIQLAQSTDDAVNILKSYIENSEKALKTASYLKRRFEMFYSWDVCQKELENVYKNINIAR